MEESEAASFLKSNLEKEEVLTEIIRSISNPKKSEFTKYCITNNEIVFKMVYIANALLKEFENENLKNQILDLIFSKNIISVFFELFSEENVSLQNRSLLELQCSYFKDFFLDNLLPSRRPQLLEFLSSRSSDNSYPLQSMFRFLHNGDITQIIISLLNSEGKNYYLFYLFTFHLF